MSASDLHQASVPATDIPAPSPEAPPVPPVPPAPEGVPPDVEEPSYDPLPVPVIEPPRTPSPMVA